MDQKEIHHAHPALAFWRTRKRSRPALADWRLLTLRQGVLAQAPTIRG